MRKKVLSILIVLLIIIAASLAVLFFFCEQHLPEPQIPVLPEQDTQDLQWIEPPAGAQILIFPINDGLIIAGYHNTTYFEKMGYPHYGIDLMAFDGGYAKIVSSGTGIVLGTEFCDNSLGYIAVIQYDDVFVPHTREVISLTARYYHMASLEVSEGDVLSLRQPIGSIDGSHEHYHHIHIELDANIEFPFHTPQVAESSSSLLYRHPATGENIIDPVLVLAAGDGQSIFVHPNALYCTEKDEPRFRIRNNIEPED